MRSLGRQTDLMFSRFAGEVCERDDYILVRTPSNPTFHWGNYLIFPGPPEPGDHERWTCAFEREFPPAKSKSKHRLYAFDTTAGELGAAAEFVAHGMKLESSVVLATSRVNPPPRLNLELVVREIRTSAEWEAVIEQQVLCREDEFELEPFLIFKQRQIASYRRMSEALLGDWYGAFLDGKLVGNLGLYHTDGVARFQQVTTPPSHRRRGICGTLVYRSASMLLEKGEVETLVMEADPEYHAARIYESVGFRKAETTHALYSSGTPPGPSSS